MAECPILVEQPVKFLRADYGEWMPVVRPSSGLKWEIRCVDMHWSNGEVSLHIECREPNAPTSTQFPSSCTT